ncbi:MAG: mechanosensitive ion channel family protein [Chloroflexota bacterium]
MEDFLKTFIEQFIAAIPNILTALVILAISLYFANLLARLLKRALEKRNLATGTAHLLAQIVRWTIIVIGVIAALQRFFDVTAFLAGLGILGFTVGFALQEVMKNFAAGIVLLVQQPFQVGDVIGVAGYDGEVLAIDLRSTEMRTLDGRLALLPNADVMTNTIVNYTRSDRRRVDLSVGVAYGSDPELVRGLVLEAVRGVEGFVAEPAPMAAFHTFNKSSLDLTAYFWIDAKLTNPFAAKDSAFTKVSEAFARRNVEIPFPIQTVLIQKES